MRRAKPHARLKNFIKDVQAYTPFTNMVLALFLCWLVFSGVIYFAEQGPENSSIQSYGDALYWAVAAFSTAGIADAPISGFAKLVGGIWIVLGSVLFFGAIVATVTAYFMRPMARPHKKIIDTIEYNLEQLDDLTADELYLLKETTDTLISHVEKIKERQEAKEEKINRQDKK